MRRLQVLAHQVGRQRTASIQTKHKPVEHFKHGNYILYPEDAHCFIGLNGSGKTHFMKHLTETLSSKGTAQSHWNIVTLDLYAHTTFLRQHRNVIVSNLIGGISSPLARDLIVRFGLYSVWNRHVKHLSTGEIRKLMLAYSLVQKPRPDILFLDQPLDGLDIRAREQVLWILNQLTYGFTRLLIDSGGNASQLPRRQTQIGMIVNRVSDLCFDILSHVLLIRKPGDLSDLTQTHSYKMKLLPVRNENKSFVSHSTKLMETEKLLGKINAFLASQYRLHCVHGIKSDDEIIKALRSLYATKQSFAADTPVFEMEGVMLTHDSQELLLDNVSFKRFPAEHWAVLGENGSGKSSLVRLLFGHQHNKISSQKIKRVFDNTNVSLTVQAVTTERHLDLITQAIQGGKKLSAKQTLLESALSSEHARIASDLVGLTPKQLSRDILSLSQGEQKLFVIAQALSVAPQILILDEITHGLDEYNRRHILRIVNNMSKIFARSTAVHLVMITHHLEEITPCFQDHLYEIRDKQLKHVKMNIAEHLHWMDYPSGNG